MAGVEGPSTDELTKRLQKRLYLAEPSKHDKRYNRNGVNKNFVPSDGSVKGTNTLAANVDGGEGEDGNSDR